MATMVISAWLLVLFAASTSPVLRGEDYSDSQAVPYPATITKTHLHFYLQDTFSGTNPGVVLVAAPNGTVVGPGNLIPFGAFYVDDNTLTAEADPNSEVIGNARGTRTSVGRGSNLTLLLCGDFEFTTGRFNGSSIAIFSRDYVTPVEEVGVVGGRGEFRMAKGFVVITRVAFDPTTGDGTYEYNATIFHYQKTEIGLGQNYGNLAIM